MDSRRKFNDEQEIEICRDYDGGMSLLQVSKKWGCSDSGLQKLLRRHGVKMHVRGAAVSRRAISPEQEKDVIGMYVDQRLSAEKIAEIYGCSCVAIRSVFRRNGIVDPIPQSREPHIHERAIKPEQEADVVGLYEDGVSTPKIAIIYHCSKPSVLSVLKRNGVNIGKKYSYRKYPLWEDMFDTIDTEEKAYWFGFLYAEGCVNSPMTTVSIGLSTVDHAHLEKFRDIISPGKPVYKYVRIAEWKGKKKPAYTSVLSIWCERLCLALHNIGISKERQEPEKLFAAVPDRLFHHWLRGYFDGDGSAGTHKKRIALVGEYKLLKWIEAKLDEFLHTGTGRAIYYPKNKRRVVGSIYFCGQDAVVAIGKFMYSDATVFLERKKAIVDTWY